MHEHTFSPQKAKELIERFNHLTDPSIDNPEHVRFYHIAAWPSNHVRDISSMYKSDKYQRYLTDEEMGKLYNGDTYALIATTKPSPSEDFEWYNLAELFEKWETKGIW